MEALRAIQQRRDALVITSSRHSLEARSSRKIARLSRHGSAARRRHDESADVVRVVEARGREPGSRDGLSSEARRCRHQVQPDLLTPSCPDVAVLALASQEMPVFYFLVSDLKSSQTVQASSSTG